MKLMAFYLPQYHAIPENDEWWGKGYTEWTAVKNAKPLYKGHREPRIPLHSNYYDLADESGEVWKWQAKLARNSGVYGFCIYHYWFEGKQLLQKPMEILLRHPEIDLNYSVCWANETWKRTWYDQKNTVLQKQTYGGEDAWKRHYEYLNQFFQDTRYIKIHNKPVIHIYHSQEIEFLPDILETWDKLAKENGFNGVYIISGVTSMGWEKRKDIIDGQYMFNPSFIMKNLNAIHNMEYLIPVAVNRYLNKLFKTSRVEHRIDIRWIYKIIERYPLAEGIMPGTFSQWDNTPRTGTMGMSCYNSTPQVFYEHLKKLYDSYSDTKNFIYINAWNEWGEGAYLEPDEEYGYGYLQAVQKVFGKSRGSRE